MFSFKAFLKALAHAAIGGAATAAAGSVAGASFKQIALASLAGALTSVFSLFSKSPAGQ